VLWKCNLDPNRNDRTNALYSEKENIRRIYGRIQDKEYWHPMCSSEIHNLYKDLNIGDDAKIRKLG
jgi:hypothetical protein